MTNKLKITMPLMFDNTHIDDKNAVQFLYNIGEGMLEDGEKFVIFLDSNSLSVVLDSGQQCSCDLEQLLQKLVELARLSKYRG